MATYVFTSICRDCDIVINYKNTSAGAETETNYYVGDYYYPMDEKPEIMKKLKKIPELKKYTKKPKEYNLNINTYRVIGIGKCPHCGKRWLSQQYYYPIVAYFADQDHTIVFMEEDDVIDACSTLIYTDPDTGDVYKEITTFPEDDEETDESED